MNAFRYRDYVIRAFNADLPYNRFVTEQIAGDLLESPRRHPAEGFNESILGTGVLFPRRGNPFAGRRARRADAADRQPDRRDLQDVSRPDGGLCPLPRPQVRPDHHQRLLRPRRVPAQLAASAGVYRSSRADRPGGRAAARAQEDDRRCAGGEVGRIVGRRSRRPATPAAAEERRRRDRVRRFQSRQLRRLVCDRRCFRRSPEPAAAIFGSTWRGLAAGPGQARPGPQRLDFGPAARGAAVRSFTIEARYIHWGSRGEAAGSTSSSTASRRSAIRSTAP